MPYVLYVVYVILCACVYMHVSVSVCVSASVSVCLMCACDGFEDIWLVLCPQVPLSSGGHELLDLKLLCWTL